MEIGVAKRPLAGWTSCGDDARYWREETGALLCIVDGLGHGPQAEEAAHSAIAYVEAHRQEPLEEILAGCDRAIRHTRGVALGLARVNTRRMRLMFAGVGNVSLLIWQGTSCRRFASANGIIGAGFRKAVPEEVPLAAGIVGMMVTDGVSSQIRVTRSQYKNLLWQDLDTLAQWVLNDWASPNDDAAVIIFRIGAEQ